MVLETFLKDTLDEAFQTLKERLDPAPDQFDAANTFKQLLSPVGESVLDFAAKYLEEGLKAGLNARQICIFMTTQLPVEVRQAAKEWIIAKGEGFSETEGISFAIKSRDLLYAKGLPLTLRFRDRGIEKVSHLRSPMVEPQNADDSSGGESSSGIEASRQSNRVRVIGRKPKYTTANYSEGHQGSECLFVKNSVMATKCAQTDHAGSADN